MHLQESPPQTPKRFLTVMEMQIAASIATSKVPAYIEQCAGEVRNCIHLQENGKGRCPHFQELPNMETVRNVLGKKYVDSQLSR